MLGNLFSIERCKDSTFHSCNNVFSHSGSHSSNYNSCQSGAVVTIINSPIPTSQSLKTAMLNPVQAFHSMPRHSSRSASRSHHSCSFKVSRTPAEQVAAESR